MLVNWSIEAIEDAAEVCLECRLAWGSSWIGGEHDEGGWHQIAPGVRCRLRTTTRRLIELSAELGLPVLDDTTLAAWRRRLFAWDPAALSAIGEARLVAHFGLETDARPLSEAAFLRRCVERDEEDRRVRSGRLHRAVPGRQAWGVDGGRDRWAGLVLSEGSASRGADHRGARMGAGARVLPSRNIHASRGTPERDFVAHSRNESPNALP